MRLTAADLAKARARVIGPPTPKVPKDGNETPLLDFVIGVVVFGVPAVIVIVIVLAALRILGWF